MSTSNPRYRNGHRRRQLRARLLAAGGTCQWEHCPWPNEPLDRTRHYLDPKAPEVDEIIPVSLGGSPTQRSNTRLLHRWCNQQRGNGQRPATQTPSAPTSPTTSTTW